MEIVADAIESYRAYRGHFPENLNVLCPRKDEQCYRMPAGWPYPDEWGHELRYSATGQDYHLRSAGRDGIFGTTDDVAFHYQLRLRRVAQLAGCYRLGLEKPWAFLLELDSVGLGPPRYAAYPVLPPFAIAYWTPVKADSLRVLWNAVDMAFQLHLVQVGDSLRGVSLGEPRPPGWPFAGAEVVAVRVPCRDR